MKKRITALALAVAMVMGTVALAAGTEKTITVTPMSLNINGQEATPTKSDDTAAEVFAYDGTTYVPLRYLSELLGITVEWNKDDNTTVKLISDKITLPARPSTDIKGNVYTGSAMGYAQIDVVLSVSGGVITAVELKADNETPAIGGAAIASTFAPALVSLTGRNVADVNVDELDTVSGATLTSSGVKSALAAALSQAKGSVVKKNALVAGTYDATVKGYGGEMTVTVTVAENEIISVEVGENSETYGVGSTAIDMLTAEILAEQNVGMDAISGATQTSGALLSAVRQALTKAGADMTAWAFLAVEDKSAKDPIKLDTEVVVVGGGGAGLSAALAAVESGAKVVVLEKQDVFGGNTALSEGNCIIVGSEYMKKVAQQQVEAGNEQYKNSVTDTPERAYNDIMVTGHFLSRPETLSLFVNNCGRAWDFIIEKTKFAAYSTTLKGGAIPGGLETLRSYAPTINRGTEFTVPMEAAIRTHDTATLLSRTEGYELICDKAGAVVGVKARDNSNGQEYIINASKGVILATGMMSGDTAKEYGVRGVYNRGKQYNTGDGQKMAIDIGADTWLLDLSCRGGRMVTDNFEYSYGLGVSVTGLGDLFAKGGAIAVEKHGRRFSDENKIAGNNELVSNLTDQCYYAVMDEAAFKDYLYVNNGGSFDYDAWLAKNNCEAGGIAHGSTLQEAARNAGIDGDYLWATVQYYNYCVEKGLEDMYGRKDCVMLSDDGPYYIMRIQPAFNTTSGGLLINDQCGVMSTNGEAIKGLYAAGNVAGGANGEIYFMGCSVGWSMTSGYIAGNAAAG